MPSGHNINNNKGNAEDLTQRKINARIRKFALNRIGDNDLHPFVIGQQQQQQQQRDISSSSSLSAMAKASFLANVPRKQRRLQGLVPQGSTDSPKRLSPVATSKSVRASLPEWKRALLQDMLHVESSPAKQQNPRRAKPAEFRTLTTTATSTADKCCNRDGNATAAVDARHPKRKNATNDAESHVGSQQEYMRIDWDLFPSSSKPSSQSLTQQEGDPAPRMKVTESTGKLIGGLIEIAPNRERSIRNLMLGAHNASFDMMEPNEARRGHQQQLRSSSSSTASLTTTIDPIRIRRVKRVKSAKSINPKRKQSGSRAA